MSTLDAPERPEGLPPRRVVPGGLDRPWHVRWALLVAFGALVTGTIGTLLALAVRAGLTNTPPHQPGVVGVALHGPPPLLTFVGTLAQDIALVAGAVLVAASSLKGRITPAHLGLRPPRTGPWASIGLVVAGYLVFIGLSAAWTSGLGITSHENIAVELGTRDSGLALAGAAFLTCVVAPICEELFFRGFVFGGLRRQGLWRATIITGLAFGLAHVASAPIAFIVPLAALGMILCLIYERTGSLYPCMALHAVNNSIAFALGDGRAWLLPVCLAGAGLCITALARWANAPRAPDRILAIP